MVRTHSIATNPEPWINTNLALFYSRLNTGSVVPGLDFENTGDGAAVCLDSGVESITVPSGPANELRSDELKRGAAERGGPTEESKPD